MNYYNEIDPFAAEWLRNLIAAGHIPAGVVDTRSIEDVTPADLDGFTQCHFFAGIGGWPLALRLAGWPDTRPIWTGSCPCQPFSAAGKGAGLTDERHLWPVWYWLISQRRPEYVVGEQVASAAGLDWLDVVSIDLENAGYAIGAADLCAASVGAPHIRQRLGFVAYRVADSCGAGLEVGPFTDGGRGALRHERSALAKSIVPNGLADAFDLGRLKGREDIASAAGNGLAGNAGLAAGLPAAGALHGFWQDADWLFCRDGKWRPVESGTFPLAHGIPGRVGRLRAYGNAIVPQVFAEMLRAFLDYEREDTRTVPRHAGQLRQD